MKRCLTEQGDHQDSLISIKTKKHKSLGVLCIFFMRLFFEKRFKLAKEAISKKGEEMILSLEEAVEILVESED